MQETTGTQAQAEPIDSSDAEYLRFVGQIETVYDQAMNRVRWALGNTLAEKPDVKAAVRSIAMALGDCDDTFPVFLARMKQAQRVEDHEDVYDRMYRFWDAHQVDRDHAREGAQNLVDDYRHGRSRKERRVLELVAKAYQELYGFEADSQGSK